MNRMRVSLQIVRTLAALVMVCSTAAASAQTRRGDTLRTRYLLPVPASGSDGIIRDAAREVIRSSPGITYSSPSAFGPNWGDGFIGLGYQRRERYANIQDGFASAGIGLGNAYQYVGMELDMVSVSTVRSGFLKRDAFSFKIHRMIGQSASVAVGWENAITTHNGLDGGNSMYAVASKVFHRTDSPSAPFSNVTLTLGAGNGRFRSERDVAYNDGAFANYSGDVNYHRGRPNAFSSVAVRVLAPVSVIADWYGQDLALGVSVVPFARIPLVITPAFSDVTRTAGDGPRFTLGAGVEFQFASLFHPGSGER